MRLFTAIELPADVRNALAEAQGNLKDEINARVSWTAVANYHLTLKFFGDVPDHRVGELAGALQAIALPGFSINVAKLGALPPRGPARVLLADIDGETYALARLVAEIERVSEPLGFEREKRRFHPHVTLGRLREPQRVVRELQTIVLRASDPFRVGEFVLMRSELRPEGARYETVVRVPLV